MIWKTDISLNVLNELNQGLLVDKLHISFIEKGENFLKASMEVLPFHGQPFGIMHGGASCVLAETVGSAAANLCIDQEKFLCVGMELNINHIKPFKAGILYAKTSPLHIGKRTQVWNILIEDVNGTLIAASRLTVAVIEKNESR